ncbi:peptidoglycan editing factor PgeF [Pseudaeromonas sp. ZJS20]|uniref:peptidoglycan editing factor PgeF n=1 Tax=Pseudaeromonas aegiceratis TaxID=3153928 RepID=UPI00390CB001
MDLIRPQWPAPSRVQACFTTRDGGVSEGVYAGLNLGNHVADAPQAVAQNRQRLRQTLGLASEPLWLEQVHGTEVFHCQGAATQQPPRADAAVTRLTGQALTVMTADCLPVLLCDEAGSVVATAHAGWRGLCDGVLEQTVQAMGMPGAQLLAWLGPAIGPNAFEVGDEVRAAFMAQDPAASAAFRPHVPGKWWADLPLLARQRLACVGIRRVYGGEFCTHGDARRFYSYRRDGQTGRMAGLIWLTP